MTDIPDTLIFVVPQTLSDGSTVYDVHMGHAITCHAITEKDALAMAEKIVAAINDHSTETAGVVIES